MDDVGIEVSEQAAQRDRSEQRFRRFGADRTVQVISAQLQQLRNLPPTCRDYRCAMARANQRPGDLDRAAFHAPGIERGQELDDVQGRRATRGSRGRIGHRSTDTSRDRFFQ